MRFVTEYVALAIGALISHASRVTAVEIARDTYFFLRIKRRTHQVRPTLLAHDTLIHDLLTTYFPFATVFSLRHLCALQQNAGILQAHLFQTRTTGCKTALNKA